MISVVGGTYTENVRDTRRSNVAGSGFRAAQFLAGDLQRFDTIATKGEAVAFGLLGRSDVVNWLERASPIVFDYSTPVSKPTCYTQDFINEIETVGEFVVAFGMVEGRPSIQATRCVLDPQHSYSLDEIKQIKTDELHLVLNAREASSLCDEPASPGENAEKLLAALNCSSVVVKCGALGGFVAASSELYEIPVFPSERVQPIGSGDIFTAAYALSLSKGQSPHAAALRASSAVNRYCSTGQVSHLKDLPKPSNGLSPPGRMPSVYLAASFATTSQRWLLDTVTRALEDVGACCFSPLRDVGPHTGDAERTFSKDRAGIAEADSVLVLLDAARTGPLVEAGIATEMGKPVVVFSEDPDANRFTMLRGAGSEVHTDLPSAVYRSIWAAMADEN